MGRGREPTRAATERHDRTRPRTRDGCPRGFLLAFVASRTERRRRAGGGRGGGEGRGRARLVRAVSTAGSSDAPGANPAGWRGKAPSWDLPSSCVCSGCVPTAPRARRGGRSRCPPRGSAETPRGSNAGEWWPEGIERGVGEGQERTRARASSRRRRREGARGGEDIAPSRGKTRHETASRRGWRVARSRVAGAHRRGSAGAPPPGRPHGIRPRVRHRRVLGVTRA